MSEVTLVHDTRNPRRVKASKAATVTQLKSQGYRVVDEAEATEPASKKKAAPAADGGK